NAAQEAWLGDTRLTLSPNPTSEATVLNLSHPLHETANLTLTDMNGRILSRAVLPAGQTQYRWDVQALTPGVYHLRMATREGTAVRALVVTR
ncbi:MAG TPA: T9SS type A sorting domain-containing protein, partial [Saprospiraceae bacterium]|nr:T9SS type A sorting domain-containing protein [Saprospiraceae bacterium]